MLRLDYLSCVLTVISTILVGRRIWEGWVLAAANSVIICVIAAQTSQTGFIPANLFASSSMESTCVPGGRMRLRPDTT